MKKENKSKENTEEQKNNSNDPLAEKRRKNSNDPLEEEKRKNSNDSLEEEKRNTPQKRLKVNIPKYPKNNEEPHDKTRHDESKDKTWHDKTWHDESKDKTRHEISIDDFGRMTQAFNETNKGSLLSFLMQFQIDSYTPRELSEILKIIKGLINTPYFHFTKDTLRMILLRLLDGRHEVPREVRLQSFETLSMTYSPVDLFHTLVQQYNSFDSLRVNNTSFRNFCLQQCLHLVVQEDIRKYKEIHPELENNEKSKGGVHEVHQVYHPKGGVHQPRQPHHPKGGVHGVPVNSTNNINTKKMNTKNNEKSKEIPFTGLFNCLPSLHNCLPFVDFLVRSIDNSVSRTVLLFICYDFLGLVKTDLLSLTPGEIPKELDDHVIMKVFLALPALKKEFEGVKWKDDLRPGLQAHTTPEKVKGKTDLGQGLHAHTTPEKVKWKTEAGQGLQANQTPEKESEKGVKWKTDLRPGLLEEVKEKTEFEGVKWKTTPNRRLLAPTTPNSPCHLCTTILFDCDSPVAITLSVYKRLFFYFLFKNKRILQTGKVFNIFSKEEKAFISRHTRNSPGVFLNIFKQIDQKCLLKGEGSGPLLLSIRQEGLSPQELARFYGIYFSWLEKSRESLKIEIFSPVIFSEQFNLRLDGSFSKFMHFNARPFPPGNKAVLRFLARYTACVPDGRGLVDPIELVALLDHPEAGQPARAQADGLILQILRNTTGLLTLPLVKRLVPVLRRLVIYKDCTLRAGLLYQAIYKEFNLIDPIFTRDLRLAAGDGIDYSLCIKGALNHLLFEQAFVSGVARVPPLNGEGGGGRVAATSSAARVPPLDSEGGGGTVAATTGAVRVPPLNGEAGRAATTDAVLVNALVFYLFHSPTFAFKYSPLLTIALSMKNKATFYLIEYLKENVNTAASFIADSLALLYDLYLEIRTDASGGCHAPFRRGVLEIFLESLKSNVLLPCMVIPYILVQDNCHFIYRAHLESSVNCVNDCLNLISESIREIIKQEITKRKESLIQKDGEIQRGEYMKYQLSTSQRGEYDSGQVHNKKEGDFQDFQRGEYDSGLLHNKKEGDFQDFQRGEYDSHLPLEINESLLNNFFDLAMGNNFMHSLSLKVPLKRLFDKIDYQEDILTVYVVLRQLGSFGRTEKNFVFSHILESVTDAKIVELVEKSREFYSRKGKGELPINLLFLDER